MKVYSVSEFVTSIQRYLEDGLGEVAVQGEIADFRKAQDRLIFFELKDKISRVSCFMMAWELKTILEEGMEIRVYGKPSLFKTSGRFHVRVREIELVGAGALHKSLMVLKEKLDKEGLFSEERKRPLPRFPEKVGLITSPDAAAYSDVLRVMKNRWSGVTVRFVACGVQGVGSISQLVSAFKYFNSEEHVDVIILTRGGGSLEDLQAFNSEDVARAIFSSRSPVVTGVGHERDWTVADLVADHRASTPSNAAEVVVPERREILFQIERMALDVEKNFFDQLASRRDVINEAMTSIEQYFQHQALRTREASLRFAHAFRQYEYAVSTKRDSLAMLTMQLSDRIRFSVQRYSALLAHQYKLLSSLSPQATLNRGYSVTYKNTSVVKRSEDVRAGDSLTTRLASGKIHSRVLP